MNEFIRVAKHSDLARGTMKCVDLAGKQVLLVHADDGIHAIDEMCTHEDASLALGCIKGNYIKCPLHGSRFDLHTGNPLEEPADVPLTVHEVKIEGDDILVRMR